MAAINPPQPGTEKNSADVEARRLLRTHVNVGIKTTGPRTTNGSASSKPRQTTGTKVSGGGRITGGRG